MSRKILTVAICLIMVIAGSIILIGESGWLSVNFLNPVSHTDRRVKLYNDLKVKNIVLAGYPVEDENGLKFEVSDVTVFFPKDPELFDKLIRTLQIVLASDTMMTRKPKSIDLRFNKAVLRY